mgnify:CR=1 FL=1
MYVLKQSNRAYVKSYLGRRERTLVELEGPVFNCFKRTYPYQNSWRQEFSALD